MGCYTILEFWRRYPARVAGMILCGTRAEADSETLFRNRMSQIERIRAEGTGFLREFAEMNLLSPATRENQPALVEEVGRWVSQAPAESVIRVLEALAVRSDSGPSLPTIFVPVLAVFGEDDTVTPVECGERLAREIPDARLAKIRAAGHLAPLEQPEVVNEEIRTFLRRFE
jgi:pimeloyl-ACP methyl ester carboxylesterase